MESNTTQEQNEGNYYSWVYQRLVTNESDLVGALAYVLYKQQKIQCIQTLELQRQNNGPSQENTNLTDQDLLYINQILSTDEAIRSYQERAEMLLSSFLQKALEKDIERLEREQTTQLSELLKGITGGLDSKLDLVKTSVESKFATINTEISEKKKWYIYLAEAFLSIIYSLFAIAIIGGILGGYKFVSEMNSKAEKTVGINQDTKPQ